MANLSNVTLGDYKIGQEFGDGGMAEIYYAENIKTKERAVLKTIRWHLHERKDITDRFQREVLTASKLKHDSIIPIHYSGNLPDGRPFVIMPYIGGGSLAGWIKQKQFNGSEKANKYIVSIISQIASALDYAHKHGVIHRDIKPDNILLTEKGFAVLTDFGIAKAMQDSNQLTNPGVIPGTPAYMAPEQIKGKISRASDIYALGVVLFELLIGQNPFKGETNAIFYQKTTKPLPSLAQFNPKLPNIKKLDRIIKKATAQEPEKRYQSATQMAVAVQNALQAKNMSTNTHGASPGKSSTPLFVIGSLVVVILLAGLYFVYKDASIPPIPSKTTIAAITPTVISSTVSLTAMPTTTSTPSGTITPNHQLALVSPQDGTPIVEGNVITFAWTRDGLENGQNYRLVVQGTNGKVIDENLESASYNASTLPPGQYSWIVLVLTKEGREIARSSSNHFSIEAKKSTAQIITHQTAVPTTSLVKLNSPILVSPPNGESYFALSRPVSFKWSSANRTLGENEYYVLIITHNDGDDFTWLKNNYYTIGPDKEWLRDFGPNLKWRVVIAQAQTSNPNNSPLESPYGREISGYSEVYDLIWKSGN